MRWTLFEDRQEAGEKLARALRERYPGRRAGEGDRAAEPPLVLALPRGGVPVAAAVARELGAPLDVLVVRKLGMPGREELALGAVASGGAQVLNDDLVRALRVPQQELERVLEEELVELRRREREYRGPRPPLDVGGREVVVVDDGIATGATMRAAVSALRSAGAKRVMVAVPLASTEACRELARLADEVVCLETPEPFNSVGQWYRRFDQTTDAEVVRALAETRPA